MIKISSSSAPRDMKFCTQLPYDHHGHIPSLGGSPPHPRMVTHQPKDGHPPKMVTHLKAADMEFDTYTLLTKQAPADNCHGWSPTILRIAVHQPKDSHPQTLGWSTTRMKCTTD